MEKKLKVEHRPIEKQALQREMTGGRSPGQHMCPLAERERERERRRESGREKERERERERHTWIRERTRQHRKVLNEREK